MTNTRFAPLFLAGLLAAVVAGPTLAADQTLSINTALTTSDPLYKGLESFRDAVAQRSNGTIEVKLFPNAVSGWAGPNGANLSDNPRSIAVSTELGF